MVVVVVVVVVAAGGRMTVVAEVQTAAAAVVVVTYLLHAHVRNKLVQNTVLISPVANLKLYTTKCTNLLSTTRLTMQNGYIM